MKLISLWEPWATLMAIGAKRIETRSWDTSYRGWLAIQASKGGLGKAALKETTEDPRFSLALAGEELQFGKIVAVVHLRTCWPTELIDRAFPGMLTEKETAFGNYADGRYGWITTGLFRLPFPIPFKAKQGLCNVPDNIVGQVQEQFRSARELAITRDIAVEARTR